MSNVGTFQKTTNGYKGGIRTLRVTLPEVILVKIEGTKRGDSSPDYRVLVEGVECGAGWIRPYDDGKKKFVSATLDDPSLPNAINFSLFENQDGKTFNASWNRPQPRN